MIFYWVGAGVFVDLNGFVGVSGGRALSSSDCWGDAFRATSSVRAEYRVCAPPPSRGWLAVLGGARMIVGQSFLLLPGSVQVVRCQWILMGLCLLWPSFSAHAQSKQIEASKEVSVSDIRGVEAKEAGLRERHRGNPDIDQKVIEELVIQAYTAQARGDAESTAAIVKRLRRLCDNRLAKALSEERRADLLLVKAALAEDFDGDVAGATALSEQALAVLPADKEVGSKVERLRRKTEAVSKALSSADLK